MLRRLKSQGPVEVIRKCIAYIRGMLISIRFQRISKVSMRGPVKILKRNGSISVGSATAFWPHVKLSCGGRTREEPAVIRIGCRCSIGDRTEILSGKNVTIGDDVIIAWDCVIMDRNYHSAEGAQEIMKPVVIKDKVWIGCHSIILKGVTIGAGAVVGAGSVVTRDVSPSTLVACNPARVIKKVKGWR